MKFVKRALPIILLLCLFFTIGVACTEQSYKLEFIVDGEVYSSVVITDGEVVILPRNPQKENYVFVGWYFDDGVWEEPFSSTSFLSIKIQSDIRVYAKFIVDSSIHHHSYSKTVIEATCVTDGYTKWKCECGHSYTSDDVTRKGHKYIDYVYNQDATYDSDGTETAQCENGCGEVDTRAKVGSKLERGKVEFKTWTVHNNQTSFLVRNACDSVDFSEELDVQGDASYFISSDEGGTVVLGKTVSLDEGDNVFFVQITEGDRKSSVKVSVYRNRMLYVRFWGEGDSSTERVEEGECISVPDFIPQREGYDFLGWDYDFSLPVVDNIIISALWQGQPKAYTIEYYFENNTGTFIKDDSKTEQRYTTVGVIPTFPEDVKTAFPHFVYVRHELTSSLGFRAYFERERYVVRFNIGEGILLSGDLVQNIKYGDSAIAPVVYREGYTYSWDTEFDCVTGNITVEALWSTGKSKVTMKIDDPFLSSERDDYVKEVEITYGEEYVLEPYVPYSKSAYEFVGWYLDGVRVADTGIWDMTEDVTLEGRFKSIYEATGGMFFGMTEYGEENCTELKIEDFCYPLTYTPDNTAFEGYDKEYFEIGVIFSIAGKDKPNSTLTKVTLPKRVWFIDISELNVCSALESIVYEGTVEEWYLINRSAFNVQCPARYIECSNGNIPIDEAFN